jgi:hypothetical protein
MNGDVSRVTHHEYINFFDTRRKVLFCMKFGQFWGRMPF